MEFPEFLFGRRGRGCALLAQGGRNPYHPGGGSRPVRALVLCALALAMSAGCFGMCGPTVAGVDGEGTLDAAFDATNQARYAAALQAAGFTLRSNGTTDHVWAERGAASVTAMTHFWPNATSVRIAFLVGPREFADNGAGQDDADAYGRRMAQEHQAEAQSILDLLADAAGTPRKPMGDLQGRVQIC